MIIILLIFFMFIVTLTAYNRKSYCFLNIQYFMAFNFFKLATKNPIYFFILTFLEPIENNLVLFIMHFMFIRGKQIAIVYQNFRHKISKINTKIFIYYLNVCLYVKNICCDIFISYERFDFF